MRTLENLLNPASIAIVGASRNLEKLNGRPLKYLLEKGYRGRIYPVNPNYDAIAELTCYPDIASVPEAVDLAVIGVAAARVPDTLRACAEKGVGAAIVFSSGFSETGVEGAGLEEEIRRIAADGGIALCGPNTLGLINSFERVMATFSQFANGDTPAGPVGFVTQSGAFGTAIAALARNRDMGLGYFVNTGNEAGVGFPEVMRDVLGDERIEIGAGYIEGVRDGDALTALARQALTADKPLVVTKVGKTGAGAQAAASHSGSLAGEDAVFDGVCAQYGIIRAADEEHLLDVVEGLAAGGRPAGRRVGLVTQSGGAGVLMADKSEELGLEVTALAPETTRRLREVVPAFGAVANPVDITAQFIAEPEIFRESIKIVLADPGVDIGVVWFQLMHEHVDTLRDVFADIRAAVDKPLLVSWVAGPSEGIAAIRGLGFPVFRSAGAALAAGRELARYAERRCSWLADPGPSPDASRAHEPVRFSHAGAIPSMEARDALARFGVETVETAFCASAGEAADAARRIGFPVAVKVESPDVTHKTDLGGVRLGIADADGARAAYDAIMETVGAQQAGARLAGVLVQAMDREEAVELVVGLKHDPVFGMMLMVGMGGIALEVSPDVSFRRAPVSADEALRMIHGLRGAALLGPVRGRAAIDTGAVARLAAAVSEFGAAHAGTVRELDLNPVRATPDGARVVDWLLLTTDDKARH